VSAAVVAPDPRWFPGVWDRSPRAIVNVLRRLLCYAGLDQLEVALDVVDEGDARSRSAPSFIVEPPHREVAAWFAGIEDDTCWFGVFVSRLQGAEDFVAVMAHEVAHAYRRFHGLEVPNRDAEEELTDLTTVYLGTGVLTANGAYRYRSGAVGEGPFSGHQWTHNRLGYLSHECMSFLLAAQCHARDLPPPELRRVARMLEPNQRASFEAALEHFEEQPESLAHRLGLPPRAEWPEPVDSDELIESVQDDDDLEADAPAHEAPVVSLVEQRYIVARERDHGLVSCALGAVTGLLLFSELRFVPWLSAAVSVGVFALPALGYELGRRWHRDLCGGRACDAQVVVVGRPCPRCGAVALSEDHPWA
jgi:hypothetical protein